MFAPGGRGVRAAVVGTGLIGGSILLRLREAGLDVRGWDPDGDTRRHGHRQGVPFADRLSDAVRDRDVVFLCGPLPTLPDTLAEVAGAAPEGCVITDVGSTKSVVAAAAVQRGLAHRFVPGHPMAGTERAGLTSAVPDLFRRAAWVLCPAPDGEIARFRALAQLIIDVFEARVVPLSAPVHDSVVALSSHIPHLLAGSLAGGASRSPVRPAVLGLAAGSFRDGTRVAGTPSRRTADMLIANRDFVLRQLGLVEEFLADLSAALREDDVEALTGYLTEARGLREALVSPDTTRSVYRFPVSGSTPASGSRSGAAGDELDVLLRLGERGGWITRIVVDESTVSYTVRCPQPEPPARRAGPGHPD
jgi:prephenate dehydrogenase